MPLLSSLLLLIVVARLLGQFMARLKQPTIVGEMLAGVILGPSIFGVVHATEELSAIAELAIFLIILSAGLEMNFKDVVNSLKGKALVVAASGFCLPFLAGIGTGTLFGLDVMRTVFLALCISITALPVLIAILQSFKLLDSRIAHYSVATAIVNDIAALTVLGVILTLPDQKSFNAVAGSVATTGGKLAILAVLILGMNALLQWLRKAGIPLRRGPEKLVQMFGSEALFGILVVFVLIFGSISQAFGFHFVIGAFFGALLIDREFFLVSRFRELERTIHSISAGFLAPIFFAYLGLEFDLLSLTSFPFVITVLLVSIFSKIFAGWIGGRLAGLTSAESWGIGIVLNGRGVMELVVASIAYEKGFIDQALFTTLLLMGVVTTILTPVLFKKYSIPQLGVKPAS